ncbi:hypothetical protein GGR54DRAFT_650412 [Hypoxylon sp. NC1633]|nr:hypothetical protein GGR54DRAFT_650412 [Hypoxylon sp. NC1633]
MLGGRKRSRSYPEDDGDYGETQKRPTVRCDMCHEDRVELRTLGCGCHYCRLCLRRLQSYTIVCHELLTQADLAWAGWQPPFQQPRQSRFVEGEANVMGIGSWVPNNSPANSPEGENAIPDLPIQSPQLVFPIPWQSQQPPQQQQQLQQQPQAEIQLPSLQQAASQLPSLQQALGVPSSPSQAPNTNYPQPQGNAQPYYPSSHSHTTPNPNPPPNRSPSPYANANANAAGHGTNGMNRGANSPRLPTITETAPVDESLPRELEGTTVIGTPSTGTGTGAGTGTTLLGTPSTGAGTGAETGTTTGNGMVNGVVNGDGGMTNGDVEMGDADADADPDEDEDEGTNRETWRPGDVGYFFDWVGPPHPPPGYPPGWL